MTDQGRQNADAVACARCKGVVPRRESLFSEQGQVLCARCGAVEQAHMQVERARQEAQEKARWGGHGGLVGLAIGAVRMAHADAQADRMHAEIAQVVASPAAQRATTGVATCPGCGATIDQSQATYSDDGRLLCAGCTAGRAAKEQERRARGSGAAGFFCGLFLSVIGLSIVYMSNSGSATRKGTAIGTLAGALLGFGLWWWQSS